ncbi:MAG: NAD(P) transhydrogenase subunit alpha [Acidobacteriota bacterium]
MNIGVVKESIAGERRVALVDESVRKLVKAGHRVLVESGAGDSAGVADEAYRTAGAEIATSAGEVIAGSEVVTVVRPLAAEDAQRLAENALLIGLLEPETHAADLDRLARRGISAMTLERVPRIARAQSMDVLSSMSTVAGYRACLMAAERLPRFFPLLMTAAGTISPARVLIIGAGVAGLQAVGTARRLGAAVEAFDPRPAACEQVESLGARFVGAELIDASMETAGGYAREQTDDEKARQREFLRKAIAAADVIICSALVAGRKAPVVLDHEAVESMRPGSVVIDLAAEQGGNCALTEPAADVVHQGVTICGPVNVASQLPVDASRMFSRNVTTLLTHLIQDGQIIDLAGDEIARPCLVAHAGGRWSGGERQVQPDPAGEDA